MSFHHKDIGSGPPVVLLHGLMASTQVFEPLITLAKDQHRFIAIDLPHSGKSGAWAPMKPEPIADYLDRWLMDHGLREVTVVGHSFGGLAAMALATKNPKRVARMVLVGTPAVGLPREAKLLLENPVADMGAAMLATKFLPRQYLRRYVSWLFADPSKLTDTQLDGYETTLKNTGCWPSMLEATRSIVGWKSPGPYGMPVEVLWGDRDRLVPVVQGEQLAIAIDAGFTVLPNVGHCVPEEDPQTLLKAIRGELRSRKAKDRYPAPR
jgi:pimeloyl-ACP methyl ester carboxylesterase